MNNSISFEAEVERNYRHNFIVNFVDGTFFWAGMSFIASSTILPLYVSRLTDSKILIGLIPTLATGGWLLPQLFTANWVQRLPQKKVVPIKVGLFSERLPIFLMALAAWQLSVYSPTLAIIAFFITFGWHTTGAGVIAVAWQDMIAKIIPVDRRGWFFGFTNFSGVGTGVLGALAATWLLSNYGFPNGYALCFLTAAILVFLSWIFLSFTKEPAQVNPEPKISQKEYWKQLPAILQNDKNFSRFLYTRLVMGLSQMAGGFYAVYAVQTWGLPDSQAGAFTTAMLIGQALCNLIFGIIADRKGHKIIIEISLLMSIAGVITAIFAPAAGWFYMVFALFGGSIAGSILSGLMIALEFSTPERRPTYIGLNSTANGITSGIAPIIGGFLAGLLGFKPMFTITAAFGVIGFILLHWWVQEPRKAAAFDLLKSAELTE